MHRIEYMAQLRNKALEPLYLHSHTRRFAKVVFLNDVFFCATDVLELLSQARIHGAHLTCAEDYQLRHGALAFYDTWVSRDILGNPFKPHHLNIADDATALVAHLNNRPYQVQCCWNGLAVIDAQVFMHPHDIRFRRSAPDECSASECSLLCNDMWAADMHRMVVVPVAKVAYDVETRSYLESSGLVAHKALVANAGRPREIDFRPGPKSVYCHPLNDPAARVPDGPASYVAIINAGAATATAA
ncbi:hypothetical protein LPJ53_005960 [Coemansia erecta]|uniref:Uncharacterized protein n=1 Tax=Coemansia erecta TaxID=147472 RepID=A0A9W7XUI1_9FUNG|nr:hypothetical protein LPJ53_005960 [Coemansia erecta]